MTNLDNQLRAAFVADPTFSGLMAGGFYWIQLPQNPTYPCGTYRVISRVPIYAQNAPGGTQAHVGAARVEFQFWSQAKDAAAELESIFQATLGVLAGFSAFATPVSIPLNNQAPSFVLNRREDMETQIQPPAFKNILDVRVWFQDQ